MADKKKEGPKKKKEKVAPVIVGEEFFQCSYKVDSEGIPPYESVVKSQMMIECLEKQLDMRREVMQLARTEEAELREKAEQLEKDFESVEQERFDVISDFTRQHKSMQDELIGRITSLENTICDVKDQLELSRIALEETRKDKDQIIAQKDKEISEQEQKMVEMSAEFKEMLKETLEKMSTTLTNQNEAE